MQELIAKLQHVLIERRSNYAPPHINFGRIAARMTLTLRAAGYLREDQNLDLHTLSGLCNDLKAGRHDNDLDLLSKDPTYIPQLDTPLDIGGYGLCESEIIMLRQAGMIDAYGNLLPAKVAEFTNGAIAAEWTPFSQLGTSR